MFGWPKHEANRPGQKQVCVNTFIKILLVNQIWGKELIEESFINAIAVIEVELLEGQQKVDSQRLRRGLRNHTRASYGLTNEGCNSATSDWVD